MMMAEDVVQILRSVTKRYGLSIAGDARRCESLLRDLCPESRREVFLLSSAVRERIPAELLGSQGTTPYPVIAARLTERLVTNLGLSQPSAAWAVDIWSSCLGVASGGTATDGRSTPAGSCLQISAGSFISETRDQPDRPGFDTVIVSSLGRGHYSSIWKALATANPGTRIVVCPGLYEENLVIDKPIEMIGDGDLDTITVSSTRGPCLTMATTHAIVRGLTFRGSGSDSGSGAPAVDIRQGKLVMEGCDITGNSSHCILICGKRTDPVLNRCKIHNGKGNGVHICRGGAGTLEGCDIWANELSGIEIREGSNPIIRNCSIHDGKYPGVLVDDNGLGTLEGCNIWANELSGIEIANGANPTIRDCRIHDGKRAGVNVHDDGLGTLERCDVWGNGLSGIHIRRGGNPTIRDCKIHDGKHPGVDVFDNGLGTLERCDIWANELSGIHIRRGGNPTIRDCTIHDGKHSGVDVFDSGLGTLERCDIWANELSSIEISSGGDPVISDCEIHDGKSHGIHICAKGRGRFERCRTWANADGGVQVEPFCRPVFEKCTHQDELPD